MLALLTKGERRALAGQLYGDDGALDDAYQRSREREDELAGENPNASGPLALPSTPILETVHGYPDGMVESLLEAVGCGARELVGASRATVEFMPDGRPRNVTLDEAVSDDGCAWAAKSLLLTSVQPPSRLSARATLAHLFVFVEPDFLACIAEGPDPDPSAVPEGADIEPPDKKRDVRRCGRL